MFGCGVSMAIAALLDQDCNVTIYNTDGLSDKVRDLTAWKDAMHIASWVLGVSDKDYSYVDVTEGSLFYHSIKVKPLWADKADIVVRIDNHLFYREDKKK